MAADEMQFRGIDVNGVEMKAWLGDHFVGFDYDRNELIVRGMFDNRTFIRVGDSVVKRE